MDEEWRPVVGVDGYEVSNLGNLRSYRGGLGTARTGHRDTPRAIHGTPDSDGYLMWFAYDFDTKKVRQYRTHATVLEAFVGPRPDGLVARHLNGNRVDNRIENLAWGTVTENRRDRILHGNNNDGPNNSTSKLTWPEVREIRASSLNPLELAAKYGVTRENIHQILKRKTWKNDPITITTTNPEGELP